VVAFVPGVIAKTLAVIVMGIAFAPLYAGIALIGGELFPEDSAPAFSLMIFAAGLCGVLFQPVISLFLSSGNPAAAYWIAGILSAITALVLGVMHGREKAAKA
jgi:MFS family permease